MRRSVHIAVHRVSPRRDTPEAPSCHCASAYFHHSTPSISIVHHLFTSCQTWTDLPPFRNLQQTSQHQSSIMQQATAELRWKITCAYDLSLIISCPSSDPQTSTQRPTARPKTASRALKIIVPRPRHPISFARRQLDLAKWNPFQLSRISEYHRT